VIVIRKVSTFFIFFGLILILIGFIYFLISSFFPILWWNYKIILAIRIFVLIEITIGSALIFAATLYEIIKNNFRIKRKPPLDIVIPEIEEKIYSYLKENVNKRFTAQSLLKRVFSNRITMGLIRSALQNLTKNNKVHQIEQNLELFYYY